MSYEPSYKALAGETRWFTASTLHPPMGSGKRKDTGHRLVRCDQSLCHLTPTSGWSQAQGQWTPTQGELLSGMGGGVPVTPGHRARSQENKPSLLPRHTFFPQVTMPSGCQGRRGDGTTRAYGSAPPPIHLRVETALQNRVFSHTRAALPHLCVTNIPCFLCPSLDFSQLAPRNSLNPPQRLNATAHIVCQVIHGPPPL